MRQGRNQNETSKLVTIKHKNITIQTFLKNEEGT